MLILCLVCSKFLQTLSKTYLPKKKKKRKEKGKENHSCMSSFKYLAKKLHPASYRKAWKSFKYHILQSKLMRRTVTNLGQRCMVAWRSISRLFFHRKFLADLTKRRHPPQHHNFRRSYYSTHVYVDQLFPGRVNPLAEPSKKHTKLIMNEHQRNNVISDHEEGAAWKGKGKAKAGESSHSQISGDDKWESIRTRFRGIDERAEEFISKFRHDVRLEREQSIFEFEEMLNRSA